MINVNQKSNCCGCTACVHICPARAIEMKEDEKGFLYPTIDEKKCIKCNLCSKVCDFRNKNDIGTKEEPFAYAVKHCDDDEINSSRSGAFFIAASEQIMSKKGVIFGCILDENLRVRHVKAETKEECNKFKGSKYVQSNMENCFTECETELKLGKWVLFSGTGCQIHGLIRFLTLKGVCLDKLITVDMVCHGVPSPGVWESYKNIVEKKANSKLKYVNFRDKSVNGWADHIETYHFENNQIIHNKKWADVFYRHIIFREACYGCKYTTTIRNSDFTMADYWGISNNAPEFDDDKGVSLVLINSEKGQRFFEEMKHNIRYKQTNLRTSMQPQLRKPAWKGWDYNFFWYLYKRRPYSAIQLYFFPGFMVKKMRLLERKAKVLIKKIVKALKK